MGTDPRGETTESVRGRKHIMRSKNVEVRGCCLGIPFGCGSLLLLGLGAGLWLFPPTALTLLSTLGAIVGTAMLALVVLIAVGWLDERRGMRELP